MAELRALLEKNGFKNVRTLLASGNVVLDDPQKKVSEIGSILEDHFGFVVPHIHFAFDDIRKILSEDPFSKIAVTKQTRLYITFLPEGVSPSGDNRDLFKSEGYTILSAQSRFVFSVLDLDKLGSVDAMLILEKRYGKGITTRNFNTIKKIAALT